MAVFVTVVVVRQRLREKRFGDSMAERLQWLVERRETVKGLLAELETVE